MISVLLFIGFEGNLTKQRCRTCFYQPVRSCLVYDRNCEKHDISIRHIYLFIYLFCSHFVGLSMFCLLVCVSFFQSEGLWRHCFSIVFQRCNTRVILNKLLKQTSRKQHLMLIYCKGHPDLSSLDTKYALIRTQYERTFTATLQ